MQTSSKIVASMLGAVVLIGVWQAQNTELLTLVSDETIIAGAANIILVYFVLALLIERACEVAMDLMTASGIVPPKGASTSDAIVSGRRMVSAFVCLVFAIVISLAGLRLVEMILEVATSSDIASADYFTVVDALGFVAQIVCCTFFPFPQTDLAYWLSDVYAKSSVAVEDGDTDLDLCDLPIEVSRHQRLTE